ncbi:ARD/ARD' family protein [Brugia pahangi]
MKIWHMEQYPIGDRRLPHHVYPPKLYTTDQLQAIAGVVSYKVDIDDVNAMKKRISRVKAERKMTTTDIFTLDQNTNKFEEKLEQLYEPVAKDVDSAFLVTDGSAYYDIEIDDDDWIRINVERGDLIIIPSGRNHRFTLTTQNKVVIQRFFGTKNLTQQG